MTLTPGISIIKLFFFVTEVAAKKLVFVPDKPFQLSLIIARQGKALGLTCKHITRLERLVRSKHSSLAFSS